MHTVTEILLQLSDLIFNIFLIIGISVLFFVFCTVDKINEQK